MSRPKGIPEDIWLPASGVYENAKQPAAAVNSYNIDQHTLAVEVSLLLMAERAAAAQKERDECALSVALTADMVADKVVAPGALNKELREAVIYVAGIFANAIRGRKA